ncbi:hypothetical protein BDV27DRAFT_128412 [Aspergillus caelatus]|uniref:Protein NO VEIN C-terminal domain-containing protein n=1 Tax=Aspergillus caelatus TaxID=61420 RepID=A0A5N7A3N1_9EURO|nr:uncharacterized protein BDV27DRAFT_128412 [Aspergillus caelatus]KAE8364464.1 hypothetical protein BDV27DRAFT_128412 [Aspergillus caelatus]
MNHLSQEQARAVVDNVRVINGGLTAEVQNALPREAKDAFKNLQAMAGGSIVHVAEDLYDADTRFIFELIQNAEDNRYVHAASRNEEPSLHFTLHQEHITVDTNEDGFSEDDVRAICSIHRSTKKQTGGYIGHKGIGFKSVFKIAYKVQIQSGPFCFSFEHHKGESGLGMITPLNETPEDLPAGVTTRISLFLIQPEDYGARANDLRELADTILLFLRKMRKLTVEIVDLESRITYQRHEDTSRHVATLVKDTNGIKEEKFYHLEKTILHDLPEHHSRPVQHEAEIILGFPIDVASSPLIEPQYVYSFLPMRHEGLNFLIQSDFITQANRQGIHLCPRNYTIREGIVDLFVQAVRYFCSHRTLKYDWLQYLPGPHIQDRFWADLRDIVFDTLKESKILLSCKGVLNYPQDLQRLSPRHCNRDGQPLLDDIDPEAYLSMDYDWSTHAENLIELGVTNLSFKNILDRLDPYLQGPSPRFLDPTLDDDWHTRLAVLLTRAITRDNNNSILTERIKRMALIPMSDGRLLSASSTDIFFPKDNVGNLIPDDLKLDIVKRDVFEHPERRKLMEMLGVKGCTPARVVQAILGKYNSATGHTLTSSVNHLVYLFKTLRKEDKLDKRVFIMDQMGKRIYHTFVLFGADIIVDDVYFETEGDYGTKDLSRRLRCVPEGQENVDINIHIIHNAYVNAVPPEARSNGRSWEQWLEEVVLVRRIPRLKHRQQDRLSTLCQLTAKHQPMTLVWILKTYWNSYRDELTTGVISGIRSTKVACRNSANLKKLGLTYFPSAELRRLCSETHVDNLFDRFLDVPIGLARDDTCEWGFLASFGLRFDPDLPMIADICSWLAVTSNPPQTALFKMYKEISTRFSDEDPEDIQSYCFWGRSIIYIPVATGKPPVLASLNDCIWEGPPWLRTKHPLAIHDQYSNDPHMVYLFKTKLGLADADLHTYLSELRSRKSDLNVPINDDLHNIYCVIWQNIREPKDHNRIRHMFTEQNLVYLPAERAWLTPASCVWADAQRIGERYGISAVYPELEDFFRTILKVQVPTTATYIEQLRRLASHDPENVAEIKSAIDKMVALSPGLNDLEALHEIAFLTVEIPSGSVELLRPTDTFFIVDRIEYRSTFQGKVPILDFSLEDVRRLGRLLKFLSLEDRYISRIVQEKTMVEQPSSEPSLSETRAFRRKAKHIYRCALHYHTCNLELEDSQTLQQLRSAVVYESDGFKKVSALQLNEISASVQSDTGLVHINDSNETLRIYIPRDRSDRQRCYCLELPNALIRLFGLRDPAAFLTLQLVFASSEDMIDHVLDGNGIIRISDESQVSISSDSDGDAETYSLSDPEDMDNLQETSYTPQSTPATVTELSSISSSTDGDITTRPFHTNYRHGHFSSIANNTVMSSHSSPPPLERSAEPDASEQIYIQLLDKVIQLARRVTLSQALQRPNFTNEPVFRLQGETQLEHDFKVGAAGELFIFELLLAELPGFNRSNWRSNIRKRVIVHPEYQDITAWNGAETADIIYQDTNSALTNALIDTGYLSNARWHGARPTYYIEVKTTTGEFESPFFMSKGQYRRMQRMQIWPTAGFPDEVYVVFRVYHLGRDSMRVKAYVDPESLRLQGRLTFTSETYSVCPNLA